ncbi:hypothetical protein [Botrimarina mediterranea]|uniref:PEP-CTERM protein-sorting domain-containing protein n=1 Tax=Botrimarina mediterranea TaxID=2528022 RepID=A0A518K8B3_9BACT|nr:hypothetical protein [Botrimarina mediterranea]QDV74038.1 hypothetical protein Spa11_22370 [Botrimarina mediterranea]QDV78668.1 hypothetical protein K2D_22750 [Planctomycetes bacterium K2D]
MNVKHLAVALMCAGAMTTTAQASTVTYAGTQYDIGGTFFPGGGPADANAYVVAGWRGSDVAKTHDLDSNNTYGSAGYAMFGTRFDYPNANATGGNAFVNPTDNSVFPNLIDLPNWVSGSQILASRKAGGWGYALIDDPQLTNGPRDFTWGASQTPASVFQPPYVKLGILDGTGTPSGADGVGAPAERWSFTLGADAPEVFRVGVMTDGLDSTNWAPSEVRISSSLGGGQVSTGTVTKNRFIDMHFFDIVGGQSGETFTFYAFNPGGGSAGISGFTFEIPEPVSATLVGLATIVVTVGQRRSRC